MLSFSNLGYPIGSTYRFSNFLLICTYLHISGGKRLLISRILVQPLIHKTINTFWFIYLIHFPHLLLFGIFPMSVLLLQYTGLQLTRFSRTVSPQNKSGNVYKISRCKNSRYSLRWLVPSLTGRLLPALPSAEYRRVSRLLNHSSRVFFACRISIHCRFYPQHFPHIVFSQTSAPRRAFRCVAIFPPFSDVSACFFLKIQCIAFPIQDFPAKLL